MDGFNYQDVATAEFPTVEFRAGGGRLSWDTHTALALIAALAFLSLLGFHFGFPRP